MTPGQTFERLVAVKDTGKRNRDNRKIWLFRCACGTMCEKADRYVKSGNTKSCGCLRREKAAISAKKNGLKYGKIVGKKYGGANKLQYGESAFNRLYALYVYRAKKANRRFSITKEDFKSLTSQPCHYCDQSPSQSTIGPRGNGAYIYSGLDRVDSNMGYTKDNCKPCCRMCNIMKHNLTIAEFRTHLKKIYNHWRYMNE